MGTIDIWLLWELNKGKVHAVDMQVNAGFPDEKINLGIPIYGRIWKCVKVEPYQILFNKAKTIGMGIDYVDFYQNINANGFTRYWDDTAKRPGCGIRQRNLLFRTKTRNQSN